jgi:hypothetical protein
MRTDAPQPVIEEIAPDEELLRVDETASIMVRPDGYYWQAEGSRQEFGPFASVEQALADMAEADGEAPEPGETLQEAEDEIGIADWIDPDTGDPAEGFLRPRLEAD